jgi:hypothetical protein
LLTGRIQAAKVVLNELEVTFGPSGERLSDFRVESTSAPASSRLASRRAAPTIEVVAGKLNLDITVLGPIHGWVRPENADWVGSLSVLLFDASIEGQYVYFVHSYYVSSGPDTAATTDYINPYSSALQRDNFFATQFHPEKSGPVGQRILENFLKL